MNELKMFEEIQIRYNDIFINLNNMYYCLDFVYKIRSKRKSSNLLLLIEHFLVGYMSSMLGVMMRESKDPLTVISYLYNKINESDDFTKKNLNKLFLFPIKYENKSLFEENKKKFFNNFECMKNKINPNYDVSKTDFNIKRNINVFNLTIKNYNVGGDFIYE